MKAVQVIGKMVLAFGICMVLSVAFNVVVMLVLPDPETLPEHLVKLLNGPKSLFVILGAMVLMLLLFDRNRSWTFGWQGPRKLPLFSIGSLSGVMLVLLTVAAVYCAGEAEVVSYSFDSAIWVSFLVTTFLAACDAITEELLFRGYMQGMVKSNYGAWAAILLSTVPFAVSHALGHDVFSNPIILLNLALAGMFLALLRELSGSLWLPIGFHFAWNSFNDVFGTADSFITLRMGPNDWISGGTLGFDNGVANTFIMLVLIVVLSFKLKRERA